MADDNAARAFVRNKGAKLPQRGNPVVRGVDRRRGPRAVSAKQQVDTDVVTGIMAERVWRSMQENDNFTFDSPRFYCECDHVDPTGDCQRYETDAQRVLDNWHPHHAEKRIRGPRANRHNVFASRSRPDNIFIVHPDCHKRIHEGGS